MTTKVRGSKGISEMQRRRYFEFIEWAAEDALRSNGIDNEAMELLLARGNEFKERIASHIQELLRAKSPNRNGL